MKIEFSIKLLTPLAISTGKNNADEDADILADDFGLPYINKKRVKGVLKEAVIEVLEICGNPNKYPIVEDLFGRKGEPSSSPLLMFENAILDDQDLAINAISKNSIPFDFVKDYFSKTIEMTAIDPLTGTAKDHSLRKIRAIKDGTILKSSIELGDAKYENLIHLALLQINSLGSSRNRGLGLVKISKKDGFSIQDSIIQEISKLSVTSKLNRNVQSKTDTVYGSNISIKIDLLEKVTITDAQGNENIVNTLTYIPGRSIWGMLASIYIKNIGGIDDDFTKIFNGRVSFSNALPLCEGRLMHPNPKNLHYNDNSSDILDILNVEVDSKTRSIGNYLIDSESDIIVKEVKTSSTFHINRENNRIGGTSSDGSIYYYEAIEPNISFGFNLTGDKELINTLLNVVFLGQTGEKALISAKLGRSKNIEYGKVKLSFLNQKNSVPSESKNLDKCTIYCLSPCIVVNQLLHPEPTIQNLERTLYNLGINCRIEKSFNSTDHVQHFSAKWESKTNLEACFDIGSAFQLKFNERISIEELTEKIKNGIGQHTHLGYGQMEIFKELSRTRFKKSYLIPNYPNTFISSEHSILDKYQAFENNIKIRLAAQNKAKADINVQMTNGQIGRILYYVKLSSEINSLKSKVKEELEKRLIYEKFQKFIFPLYDKHEVRNDYHNFKTYVEAYLKQKRLLNKNPK